jgi:hypothetical protein
MAYNPKVFIGVANSQEFVPAYFHWGWEKMVKPYEYTMERFDHSDCFIRNNQMIEAFLESDYDVMVKMDIDQKYSRGFLEKMVPLVEKYKAIGPLIHNKWRKKGYFPLMHMSNSFPYVSVPIPFRSGIVEVPYSHSNLFLAREVLEKIDPPWYEGHFNAKGTGRTSDVDYTFIDKIKAAGYPVYINTDIEAKHLVLEYIDKEMSHKWNGYQRI